MKVVVTLVNGEKFNVDLLENNIQDLQKLDELIEFSEHNALIKDAFGNRLTVKNILYYKGVE